MNSGNLGEEFVVIKPSILKLRPLTGSLLNVNRCWLVLVFVSSFS